MSRCCSTSCRSSSSPPPSATAPPTGCRDLSSSLRTSSWRWRVGSRTEEAASGKSFRYQQHKNTTEKNGWGESNLFRPAGGWAGPRAGAGKQEATGFLLLFSYPEKVPAGNSVVPEDGNGKIFGVFVRSGRDCETGVSRVVRRGDESGSARGGMKSTLPSALVEFLSLRCLLSLLHVANTVVCCFFSVRLS